MSTLSGFEEHQILLDHAHKLRAVVVATYGNIDDPDFNELHEIDQNEAAVAHLVSIEEEILKIAAKRSSDFSADQSEELRLIFHLFKSLRSYCGIFGFISLIHAELDSFIEVLEKGRICWE